MSANRSSSLATKAIAWAIVIVVALLLFSFVTSVIAGLVKMFMAVALLAVVVFAVIWAVRRL